MNNHLVTAQITLIQQNDTHAQMDLHWEHFWKNGHAEYRRVGGYARAATVARDIKRKTGAALLIDCGDAIHGTLPAMRTDGQAIVPILNAMGVDLMTPGNWEYGFGPQALRARMAELAFPVIACNLRDAVNGERLFPPYKIIEMSGIRIGFVGLTSPIVPGMSPAFAAGLRFPAAQTTLPRCVEKLRRDEAVDLVVLVSHLGYAQDVALARQLDGLDVILSGHTHNRLENAVRVGGTIIIQSGFSTSFLGRLDLEIVKGVIVDVQHQLITLEETIVPDPEVQEVVAGQLAPHSSEMTEVVGRTDVPLNRMGLLETTTDNLITDSYLALTNADVAVSHGWRYGPPVAAGDVCVGDLWAMIPTNPEVFTVQIKGEALQALLEENMHHVLAGNPLEQSGGYLMRASGLSVVFRPNNPRGTRIEHLDIAGAPVDKARTYTVASAGNQDLSQVDGRQDTGVSAIDAIRQYFKKEGTVHPALTHRKYIAQ